MYMNRQLLEENCICSIENNNLDKVKQFLSSGFNINSFLTTRNKIWDANCFTILAIASFSGSVKIVEFLIQHKVYINQVDNLKKRTALHWAAVSGNYEVAKILIEAGAFVNVLDRDSATPLIYASNSGNLNLIKILIKKGANVNSTDRVACSPLHYACMRFQTHIAKELIMNGCTKNTSFPFPFGTPLKYLVYDKQYYVAKMLIEAGCDLSNEKWIQDGTFTIGTKNDEEFLAWIRSYIKKPPKLMNLCRKVIRNQIGSYCLAEKIKTLNIPKQLKDYLIMKY